jgi:heme oxygenase
LKPRLQRLRQYVTDHHEALEETAVARELLDGEIDRSRYIQLHGQLYHIHRHLDDAYVGSSQLQPFWDPEDLRSTILKRDLANLDWTTPPSPLRTTREVIDEIPEWHDPWPGLVGTLYVVKGGRFGAKMLVEPISKTLDVPPRSGEGLDYYLHGKDVLPRQWRSFTNRVNEAALSTDQEQKLFSSARSLFEGLLRLYRAV